MISLQEFKNKKLTVSGPRLYLRALESADATPDYCRWLNDPEVNRFLATKAATIEELRQYILSKNSKSDTLFCGIFVTESNTQIGTIKLEYIDWEKRTADIALMIGDKRYWGQGMAAEAMRILIEYAFRELRLLEVTLGVLVQNEAAVRVYRKLGFVEQKREYQRVLYGEHIYDQMTMVLKKEPFTQ